MIIKGKKKELRMLNAEDGHCSGFALTFKIPLDLRISAAKARMV